MDRYTFKLTATDLDLLQRVFRFVDNQRFLCLRSETKFRFNGEELRRMGQLAATLQTPCDFPVDLPSRESLPTGLNPEWPDVDKMVAWGRGRQARQEQ